MSPISYTCCWILLLSVGWATVTYGQLPNKIPVQSADSFNRKDTALVQVEHSSSTLPVKALPLPEKKRTLHFYEEILFYWIAAMIFILGTVKTLFPRYSENLTKVMFNSTLRQSQLIEQLIQARRPSFYMNLLFILSVGTFLSLCTMKNTARSISPKILLLSIGFVASIFIVKSISIRILGWLSGYQREAKDYLFLVWLTNKALGVLFIPFVCLMAFGGHAMGKLTIYLAVACLLLLYAVRYLRVYNAVKFSIRVSQWHMLLYMLTMELIPMGLVYKMAADFVFKM